MNPDMTCDVAVIGGSLGGSAAEIGALDYFAAVGRGGQVVLAHAAAWVGGQITSQGVSALDEHPYIETFGATARYLALRSAIRQDVIAQYGAPPIMATSVLGPNLPLNPGNGWVSRLCFLPEYGVRALERMAAHPRRHRLHAAPIAAHVDAHDPERRTVRAVILAGTNGDRIQVQARYVLDATDLGDLLPLTGTAYTSGAESQAETGEPHAAIHARPGETQGFTYSFAVEYRPGEDHTIPKPEGYERLRDSQPYTLSPLGRDGAPVVYRMFADSPQGNLPFWSYRRLHAGDLLGGGDISLINWISNDYHGRSLIDVPPDAAALAHDEAKRLSLGFLYWLQTECPRDDGGFGYPELKLRPDVMGSADGLSQEPYIRESRRIVAHTRIVEQDIVKQDIVKKDIGATFQPGARARHHADSIGIGWYAMDLHPCVGNPNVSMYAPTRPFQIPLGALVARSTRNLIPACKNIGTTHLTNGAYRLHPVEWAVGEAAGVLAAFCIAQNCAPSDVLADPWLTWRLQAALVRQGCPVFWAVDVPTDHPLFVPTQLLLVRGVILPESERWSRLNIGLDQPLGDSIDADRLRELAALVNQAAVNQRVDTRTIHPDSTWRAVCAAFLPALQAAL
ncbi:MAG: FAD-dependent oxidoreductase [bacterium]|nr:FAD-dependent oxidoreductase [bacterium]